MNTPITDKQNSTPILQVRNLFKHYPSTSGKPLVAVNDVSISINQGEVLGTVGESGCGISQIIEEPLLVHSLGNRQLCVSRVTELLELVGLPTDSSKNYRHEFSGGQRQRIAIARAPASNPFFLVCDEAVSALDVSVQSQILNLLMELRQRLNLAMMFISHDLSVIRHISDRVAVMYLGKIVDSAPTEKFMNNPQHPYTQALLSAIPHPLTERKTRIVLQGELPDPANPPTGCIFHARCHKRHLGLYMQCVGFQHDRQEGSRG
jgi:oligopeptide/dipeptide ABC transporter ATP-binding protein